MDKFDEAIKSYEQAIKLNPDYAEAYSNKGNTLRRQFKLDEAIISYNKSIFLEFRWKSAGTAITTNNISIVMT